MRVLMVVAGLLAAGNGAVLALLADLQDETGLSTSGLGLVAGASFAAALVCQLALARYADRGRARQMLMGGAVLAAFSALAIALASEGWHLVVARLGTGLGYGLYLPAARKITVTLYPDNVAERLGRLLGADIAGFVAGAPVAAGLVTVVGLRATFLILAAGTLLLVLPLVRLTIPPLPLASAERSRGVVARLLLRPRLRGALALGAATFAAIGVFDTLWARYLKDLGGSTTFVAVTLLMFGIPMALLTGPFGRLADRRDPARLALFGVAASAPCLVAYGQVSGLTLPCVLALGHALLDALNFPATQATVAGECEPDEVAAGQGLLSGVQVGVGGLVALPIAPVYDRWGADVAFGAGGLLMVVGCLLAMSQLRARPAEPTAAFAVPATPG
jgi:predicted MFS family arabinose efflux permease